MFLFVFYGVMVLNWCCTQGWSKSPNFVVVLADDMGWGDFGINMADHATTESDTPGLDRLAKEGMRFTDFHSAASTCSPSRASLLTGRLGVRTGVTHNFSPLSVAGLALNETTIAEVLSPLGYATAAIGKWHLGHNGPFHPNHRGFNYFFGLPYSADMGCTDNPGADIPACRACPDTPARYSNATSHGRREEACSIPLGLPLYEDLKIVDQPTSLQHFATQLTNKAVRFIEQQSAAHRPFFLYLALSHMHVPLATAPIFVNSSHHGQFGDTLREMDWVVKTIANTLSQLHVENDTLLWFTSDNGPWSEKCQFSGNSGPFVGKWQQMQGTATKTTTWEGGHRVPGFVYWPTHIQPNQTNDALLSTLDIFPTLLSLANVSLPPNRQYDGMDVHSILQTGSSAGHKVLFHPNSGAGGNIGAVETIRLGQYKAYYRTAGATACDGSEGVEKQHSEPLLFALNRDVSEAFPLPQGSEEYCAMSKRVHAALRTLHQDVERDNTTRGDYAHAARAKPCCNVHLPCCRCHKYEA
uniref:arylsulfatase G isoform X2 n=1 Tax=Myxine glutinosa TaxID=7769 RepID=UPI00358E72CB